MLTNIKPCCLLFDMVSRSGHSFRITDRYFHDRRIHLRNSLFAHFAHARASRSIAMLHLNLQGE